MNEPTLITSPAEIVVDRLKTLIAVGGMGIIAVASFFAFRHNNRRDADLAAYPRYTVGQVTRTTYVIGPSPESLSFFAYQVGDSTYTGTSPGDLPDGQTLFLVKYSTQHPQYYKFYKRVPLLPSHIPPPEGWATPPYPVPAKDLE